MPTIFTKIIKGDIPSYKIAEDEKYYAFLDINPFSKGHVLVVPKVEIDYLFDIEDNLYTGLMLFSKKVAIAIKEALPCHRVGVLVQGTEVPHAHVHLIPFYTPSGAEIFGRQKITMSDTEFEEVRKNISNKFNEIFVKSKK